MSATSAEEVKATEKELNAVNVNELESNDAAVALKDWTDDEEKKLVRKMDIMIVPFMVFTFIFNYIDRSILPNARLKGLQSDLGLTDVDYATCISILFVGYLSMQVPGNIVLNKIKWPRYFFMAVIAMWGGISACTGAVHNYPGLVMCRFFLGVVEATLYPGAIYYLSRFYTKKEMGLRIAYLNIGATLSSGIGSLIAAGVLAKMQGVHGLAAWRWLFIIEGCITVALGLLAPICLLDYPDKTTRFNDRERHIALTRLVAERGVTDDADERSWATALNGIKLAAKDPVTWLFTFTYFCAIDSLGFSVYLPSILATFKYSTTITLVMVFPTAVFQTITGILVAYFSDKTGKRYPFMMFSYGATLIGYIIFMATPTTQIGARYFAIFLATLGFHNGIILLTWVSTSTNYPPAKRAAMIAFVNGLGNLGQIPSSYYFQSKWGPSYRQSMGIETAWLCAAAIMCTIVMITLKRRNAAMDRGELSIHVPSSVVAATEDLTADGKKEAIIRSEWRYQL